MNRYVSPLAIAIVALASVVVLGASPQDHQHEQMKARGKRAMGFDQAKATHHFRLMDDGGTIEVTANDPRDGESVDQIRAHLSHIATMFAEGNFDAPMLTHTQTPPGTDAMIRLKDEITYKYFRMDRGGRVRISTANPEAVKAIRAFLRFQIDEHRTGDKK